MAKCCHAWVYVNSACLQRECEDCGLKQQAKVKWEDVKHFR